MRSISHGQVSIAPRKPQPQTHIATPVLESHEPLRSRSVRRQGREEARKKKNKLQLLPVTRRGAFGRCHASSEQNRPPAERKAGREEEAREKAQPRAASSSVARYLAGSKIAIAPRPPTACRCFLGSRATHTRHAMRLRSAAFPPRRRQPSSLLSSDAVSRETSSIRFPSFPFFAHSATSRAYLRMHRSAHHKITSSSSSSLSSLISPTIRPDIFSPPRDSLETYSFASIPPLRSGSRRPSLRLHRRPRADLRYLGIRVVVHADRTLHALQIHRSSVSSSAPSSRHHPPPPSPPPPSPPPSSSSPDRKSVV